MRLGRHAFPFFSKVNYAREKELLELRQVADLKRKLGKFEEAKNLEARARAIEIELEERWAKQGEDDGGSGGIIRTR